MELHSLVTEQCDINLYAAAFAGLREPVILFAENGQLLLVNPAARRLLALEEISLPTDIHALLPMVDESSRELIRYQTQDFSDEDWLQHIIENALIVRHNGSEFPFELTATVLHTPDKNVCMITLKDLFQVRSLADTIHFQRSHDQLTGLCNRSEFERRLQDSLVHNAQSGGVAAMAYIDVDQFKVINDTCGHIAGDELLRQITELIRFELQPSDMLARIGGDEFGVLFSALPIDAAKTRCENIRKRIENFTFTWSDKSYSIAVSIGLAPLVGNESSWATVMGQADAACFHAKEAGRNQVRLYTDDEQVAQRHTEMQWVSRIVQALQQDKFKIYAQPIVNSRTGKIAHQEILVRMIDQNNNIVPPGIFLPAAERFNLILMVDKWVFKRTLDWLDMQRREQKSPIPCAINVSGASIGQTHFADYVEEQIRELNIPPQLISFEVTETAAVNNLHSARQFIARIKELGCTFAIDDFGAGMSSFAYLKNLPADYLKIDGIFVKEMANNIIDYAMVKSINEVGHVMGMKTIAEFVENDAILEKLREIGVDYAQGYGIGKPQELI